jgi:hypothetical protein
MNIITNNSGMGLPKIQVLPSTLARLLNDMHFGRLQVPRFQREFVWPLTKTRELLDSMYKEFPIGTFFLWHAPPGTPSLIRPLRDIGIPDPPANTDVAYILDGQQRLTSLFVTIFGLSLGSRNYGRISMDLETATRYDQTQDDSFEEDIFVYHTPDNERYVAVQDLVGLGSLMIFNQLPTKWQPAFNKAYNLFQTYPFSVVWIDGQDLSNAIVIFQRINQSGQRLSRYDLVCANVWTHTFDFRKRVSLLNEKFRQRGFGILHETIYTQAFALIVLDKCTTEAELSLTTDDLLREWDRAVTALEVAVDFACTNLGVKRAEFLPYRGMLPVLAYYFYHAHTSAISAKERKALWNWFWRVALSERYSSTSPSRMAEDAQKLRSVRAGQEVIFDYPTHVTLDAILETTMTSTTSALRNAMLCMLALRRPLNFKDGSPVNLGDEFFADLKRAERHHIFPVAYLKRQGRDTDEVHRLPNFCFIPADLNKEISDQEPASYMKRYRDDNPAFGSAAESQVLPVGPDEAIWRNDFDGFLKTRARILADTLNRLPDSPLPVAKPDYEYEVDQLEVRLREFIDHRLTAVFGRNYWRRAIPGDAKERVAKAIEEHISRNQTEDETHLASGRRQLDFCDVSDYERIILANWQYFGQTFSSEKAQFQVHLGSYRTLRNCVQHNRVPNDIELQMGRAAMTWLGRALGKYESAIFSQVDIESVEESPTNGTGQ